MLKLIRYISGLIVLGLLGTTLYQFILSNQDDKAYPAPGVIYTVDKIDMHLDCRGEGSPTLVLEAGLSSGSSSWLKIHDEISTRTCAYDRPGLDWSEPLARRISAEEVSQRLHKLLSIAGINDNIVLLGMSAGGIYVREYYKQYPEKVIGMVLVDSSHEQQANRLPKINGAEKLGQLINACRFVQPLGLIRISGVLDSSINQLDISTDAKKSRLARLNQSYGCAAIYWEQQSFANEMRDEQPPASLGTLPLLVLSQGEQPKADPRYGITLDDAISMRKIWNELQIELSQLSTNSERVIAEESGHVIQLSQPELLVAKVNQFIERLR